jgi:acetolactate synthase I/II/III large subunit
MADGAPLRVADVVVDALARGGAATVFTAPGGRGVATLTEAAARRGLRIVETTRAAAACTMASVTGFLTDTPGAAALSLEGCGPEVQAALDQATRDRAPLVVLTDGAFAGPFVGSVKASVGVEVGAAAHWSAYAIQCALTEPRGPVILFANPEEAVQPAVPLATAVRPGPPPVPDASALDAAAACLIDAERPVLVAGLQCRAPEVGAWLRALAESLPAPVLVTAGGKGALPDPHPLHLGLLGHGRRFESVLDRADLVVAIGVDALEVSPSVWPARVPVLRLASSPWTGAEEWAPREITGDIALIIEELAPRLRGRQRADWDVAELDRIKRVITASLAPSAHTGRLTVSTVVRIVREATPPGTIAVAALDDDTDTATAAWLAVAPGELVAPSPPERSGFAVPAALAAQVAYPRTRVVCFASARQVLDAADELATIARLALPVLVLVSGSPDDMALEDVARSADRAAWMTTAVSGEPGLRMAIEAALSAARPALIDARQRSVGATV